MDRNLITLKEFERMSPKAQGYAVYMQAHLPGSELRFMKCPYESGTVKRLQWDEGQLMAVMEAQDSEE